MITFTFLKIPVTIHTSFWVFLIFFSIGSNFFICASVLFLSLLFHEYGHGLTALYFSKRPEIHLVAFGGYASYDGIGLNKKQKFFITLNGPLATGILICLSYYLLKIHIFQNYYILYFLYVSMRLNIFWGIINLIPLYPLDGGRLLKNILETKFQEKGLKASLIISIISAILGCSYFFFWHDYYFGIILLSYGLQNLQRYKTIYIPAKQNNFGLYNNGLKAMENNEMEKAKSIFKKLLKTRSNQIRILAKESLAYIFYKENEKKKAYNMLLKMDHDLLKKGKCLLCKLAYEKKNYTLIEKYSRDIYDIDPSYKTALLNSKAFAYLNNPKYAGGWMQTASLFEDASKDTLKEILEDKIYDSVRDHEFFKESTKDLRF